MSINCKH